MKTALITGIAGQDGSFLAESLLEAGYRVFGFVLEGLPLGNVEKLRDRISRVYGDMADFPSVAEAVEKSMPDEVYNLAAMSFVADSWKDPAGAAKCNAIGPLNLLEALRRIKPSARLFQASSCEIFGRAESCPQSESTPFHPVTPYGIAKLYAQLMVENYRRSYGMFACSGIFFNHESERRGPQFVTRKITVAAARIRAGLQDCLELGNLSSKRDWGYAPDYVRAAVMMLSADSPRDYVISSGRASSVREFAEAAFSAAGFSLAWDGEGVNEKGIDMKTGRVIVRVNPEFFRPTEISSYLGDSSRIERELGWRRSVSFEEMVRIMTEFDMREVGAL